MKRGGLEMTVIAPLPAEIRDRFPEFLSEVTYPDEVITALGTVALRISSVSQEAVTYLVAHLLTLEAEKSVTPDGGSGVITSEGLGPKSASYMNQATDGREVFFERSAYGRMFLTLERRSPKRAFSFGVFR